jgi:hypothetical protein
MILDLALSYTPPGSELSLTLATVRDPTLLAAALDIAITEADASALHASNPVEANGFTVKAAYLRRCREQAPRTLVTRPSLKVRTAKYPANLSLQALKKNKRAT